MLHFGQLAIHARRQARAGGGVNTQAVEGRHVGQVLPVDAAATSADKEDEAVQAVGVGRLAPEDRPPNGAPIDILTAAHEGRSHLLHGTQPLHLILTAVHITGDIAGRLQDPQAVRKGRSHTRPQHLPEQSGTHRLGVLGITLRKPLDA